MLFYEQPTAAWVPFDFKLLEAYQRLQDETCPKCGHPVWLCRSTGNRVEFRVREAYCAAERTMKEYENRTKRGKEKPSREERKEWGRYHYTEPKVPHGVEGGLPTRKEFYEEMASKNPVE